MRTVDLIARKRDGLPLSPDEIDYLVQDYTQGNIPDYQISALLMAIYWQGMTIEETISLTDSMVRSGEVLDLSSISAAIVDKHSTGGVGDKTTLVVAPLLAACGVHIAKMAGRGLGFTGGTIDKLESFSGFNTRLTKVEFLRNLQHLGIAITSQTTSLAPADGKLYSLRDVTATVESLPLIASSVMSKKIAAGATIIALDVKAGNGAFMKSIEDAVHLAHVMVEIGRSFKRKTLAVISDMDQPLGKAIGNVLEVKEAIATLHGEGPSDLRELSLALCVHALMAANPMETYNSAMARLTDAISSGRALTKLANLVAAQGGNSRQVYEPESLGTAPFVTRITSLNSGFISSVDAHSLGLSAMMLGAGRAKKGDAIDHLVGLEVEAKKGEFVSEGNLLATVHARDEDDVKQVRQQVLQSFSFSDSPITPSQLIHQVVE